MLRYYAPSTSILKIPVESRNAPFIFEEITSDYQGVSVQGEVVYRIAYPERIKDTINFSVDSKTLNYLSEEQGKIGQRIINITSYRQRDIEKRSLKEMLRSADELKRAIIYHQRRRIYQEHRNRCHHKYPGDQSEQGYIQGSRSGDEGKNTQGSGRRDL